MPRIVLPNPKYAPAICESLGVVDKAKRRYFPKTQELEVEDVTQQQLDDALANLDMLIASRELRKGEIYGEFRAKIAGSWSMDIRVDAALGGILDNAEEQAIKAGVKDYADAKDNAFDAIDAAATVGEVNAVNPIWPVL
jgi:hypothetical protein